MMMTMMNESRVLDKTNHAGRLQDVFFPLFSPLDSVTLIEGAEGKVPLGVTMIATCFSNGNCFSDFALPQVACNTSSSAAHLAYIPMGFGWGVAASASV